MKFNGNSSKPPVVVMTINTADKTIEQLEKEVHDTVFDTINSKLTAINGTISDACFNKIKAAMEIEGTNIVDCMISQLHMEMNSEKYMISGN